MLRTAAPGEGGGALGQCSLVWKPAVEALGVSPERLCAPACGGMIITLPPGRVCKDCPNLHSLLRVCVSNLLLGETGPERGLWDAEEHLEIASACPSRRHSASRTRGSADLGRESRRILEETVSAKKPGTSGVLAVTLALPIQRFCVRDACITCGREDHAVNEVLHGPTLQVGTRRRASSKSRFSSTINSCWWI
mmetsp:Transcript_67477/g.158319  ORF Transcript_67477/g.158319 Transcript_67477/m.158319 type:complete len:194 (-) Transcript_67477:135-716(-)